jgi:CelD/BcsL family acetyltransferase involved in cellulose biosynthesis
MTLSIEKIIKEEEFEALAQEWNELLRRSASNTLTLTHEWLSTWWEVFGEGRELYILLVRDGKQLIGIAPMLKRTVQHYGVLPFRRIEFLASGEDEADEICSDYLDFILLGGRETEALDSILRYIYEKDTDWDEVLLTDMAGDSVNLPFVKAFCEDSGIKMQQVRDEIAVYLPLTKSFEEIVSGVSSNFRRKIRQDIRAFQAYGGEFRLIDRLDRLEEGFAALVELHQARWLSRGGEGVFSSRKFTRFHRLFAGKAIVNDWLRLYVALKDGKPIAAIYNFVHNNKVHYYQSGFKHEDSGLHSPGVLAQAYAIERAIEAGFTEFDFLKGKQGSYKFRWRPQTRSLVQMRLSQARTKEVLYNTTSKVIDGLRNIKKSLKNTAVL